MDFYGLIQKNATIKTLFLSVGWNTRFLFFHWSYCLAASDPLGRGFGVFGEMRTGSTSLPRPILGQDGKAGTWGAASRGTSCRQHWHPMERLHSSSVGVMETRTHVRKPLLPGDVGNRRNHLHLVRTDPLKKAHPLLLRRQLHWHEACGDTLWMYWWEVVLAGWAREGWKTQQDGSSAGQGDICHLVAICEADEA